MREPYSPGALPAITPHLNADNLARPAFTAEDASTYVLETPARELELVQKYTKQYLHPSRPSTAASVEFMTGPQADQLFETGLTPDTQVCVVELHGRFSARWNPKDMLVPGAMVPGMFKVLYLVFDARTGNFLLYHAPLSSMLPIQRSPGSSAITPYLNPNDPTLPAYTTDDARNWVLSRSDSVTIYSVNFITNVEARAVSGNTLIGQTPETPTCVVDMTSNSPGGGFWHAQGRMAHYAHCRHIFDGRTGNSLEVKFSDPVD